MNLDKYISELLFSHDCVIIPGFGGFVANYAPAKIHPTQHTLSAPSKKIAFNKKLQNNDGLLAAYICKEENVSYADANKTIESHVEMFNAILKDGKQLTIKNVGQLFFDIEKNLQFKADNSLNYLLDSFGLISIQSPAIKRDNIHTRIEKQFQDRPAIQAPAPIKRFPWKVLIPVPFIALAIWGSFYSDTLSSLSFHYNSFNPFAATRIEVPVVVKTQPAEKVVTIAPAPLVAEETVSNTGETTIAETPAVSNSETGAEQQKPVMEAVNNTVSDNAYFIVAGCFKEEANADKMLESLKAKGFNALIQGKNAAGLTIVCYSGFATKQEAVGELAKIKSENDQNAWLYSN